MCTRMAHLEADKCGYCGEWLDPEKQRAEAKLLQAEFYRKELQIMGDRLICERDAVLPGRRCYLCGSDHRVSSHRQTFHQSSQESFAGNLLRGLVPAFLSLIFTMESASVTVPICRRCELSWIVGTALEVIVGIVGFVVLPLAGAYLGHKLAASPAWGALAGIAAWAALFFFVVRVLFVRGKRLVCMGVDEERVTLQVPRPDIVRAAINGD